MFSSRFDGLSRQLIAKQHFDSANWVLESGRSRWLTLERRGIAGEPRANTKVFG